MKEKKKNKKFVCYFVFLLPCILLFLFFYAYPTITVITTCMTDWSLGQEIHFNGLENFVKMFQSEGVRIAMINTLKWLVINCVFGIGIALMVAVFTRKQTKFNRFVKIVYLIPNMISTSVIGFIFYFVFNPSVGLVNNFINIFAGGSFNLNWYQDMRTAFLSVTLTGIFYGGISTLMMSSEISAIPEEIIESAKIDGATDFQIDIWVVLPMIKNIIGTTLILATVNTLKTFDIIYLTTKGGPGNATMNLPVTIFRTSMSNNNYGYANAISVVTILIGTVTIFAIDRIFMKEREKGGKET